jgi:cytochrome P450
LRPGSVYCITTAWTPESRVGDVAVRERDQGYHPVLTHWNPLEPSEVADPFRAFAIARREAPVFYNEFYRAWIIAGYDEVQAVMKDTKRISNRQAIGSGEIPDDLRELMPNGFVWDYPSLENNDPPGHTRIRKLADEAFNRNRVNEREPEVHLLVDELIDGFVNDGHVEFMSRFADPLPSIAICRFLGVPEDMSAQVMAWSDATTVMMDPNLPLEKRRELARGQADFYSFCESFIEERRQRPKDDLMSRLIDARVEGEAALTVPELISTFSHFLLGGNLTTRRLLGNMVLRLLQYPDQMEAVRHDLKLAPRAVEEALRHVAPVKCLGRTTLEPVDIGGVTIPAGEDLLVMWASANHDEKKFERPEEFDIFRKDVRRHVAFSKFAHFCIGAPFARLEARVALEQLLTRLPNLRRADVEPLQWAPLVNHMGLERLNLAWDT